MSEFHPLVELLLARMKSHPEEFTWTTSPSDRVYPAEKGFRWNDLFVEMEVHLTPEEGAAIKAAAREIRMGILHERALDELLNGEDRRRKEREEQEELERQYKTMQATMGAGAIGTPIYSGATNTWGTAAQQQMRNQALQAQMQQACQGLEIAKQQLNSLNTTSSVTGKIKKALGL